MRKFIADFLAVWAFSAAFLFAGRFLFGVDPTLSEILLVIGTVAGAAYLFILLDT